MHIIDRIKTALIPGNEDLDTFRELLLEVEQMWPILGDEEIKTNIPDCGIPSLENADGAREDMAARIHEVAKLIIEEEVDACAIIVAAGGDTTHGISGFGSNYAARSVMLEAQRIGIGVEADEVAKNLFKYMKITVDKKDEENDED